MKSAQMRTSKNCVFRVHYSKGLSLHQLCLEETQRQAGARENFIVRKMGRLCGCPDWMEAADRGKLQAS